VGLSASGQTAATILDGSCPLWYAGNNTNTLSIYVRECTTCLRQN
jgi:hypothetical protein